MGRLHAASYDQEVSSEAMGETSIHPLTDVGNNRKTEITIDQVIYFM